jgi:hypothetical protein
MMSPGSLVGQRVNGWQSRLQRIDPRLAAPLVLVVLALGFSATIVLPPRTSIRTNIKMLHYNSGGVPLNPHATGCGTYRDTAQVGYGLGATIQIAAGFCWNGKNVRWIWGLHRSDCAPVGLTLTVVTMTCSISGGHNGGYMGVRYEARVASAIFPYFQHTVVREVLVTPQGYVLQIPGY